MPDLSVSSYPTQYGGRMRKWHPAMAVHRSAQGLSQEGQTENITFLKREGGQRPVRIGMSCAGMRMLAWILGYLLTLSMLMPSCCCAQCPQLCVIACFAHMPCASLRDSGRHWHSILCLYPSWGSLSHKNDSEGLIWTAGSLLARKVCLPEGRGIFRVHCRDVLDLQTRDCPHRL